MRWEITTLILCTYGFLKEFRPTEPYLYEYEHVTLNISEEVLNGDVYPIWTYSYLIALIPVFLLTDLLLYKPVIVMESLSYITVWALFVFGKSVLVQQIIEVFYGWATAGEIAYYSYIYVKVEKAQFKRVTSLTYAALLAGRFTSYVVGQLVILCKWGDYETLNWISWIALLISLIFAVALPMVSWQTAYQKKLEHKGLSYDDFQNDKYLDYAKYSIKLLYQEGKAIYTDPFTLKWSLWWAFATCALLQVTNYTQTLWGTIIDVKNSDVYNGITEALCPLLSIPVVLLMEKVMVDWSKWGELVLTVCSLLDGGLLLTMAITQNLFVMYVCYIIYRVIYQAMIAITQFNLANRLATDSYGLVFGLNTFIALVMQTILTVVVADSHGLGMSIRPQFYVYSGYHFVVAVIFFIALLYRMYQLHRERKTKIQPVEECPQSEEADGSAESARSFSTSSRKHLTEIKIESD